MTTAELLNELRGPAVFLVAAVNDVCWARYVSSASEGSSRLRAASWSAALLGLGAFNVVEYTTDHVLLAYAVAGAFVGTFVGVKKK